MTEKLQTDSAFNAKFLEQVPMKRFGDVDDISSSFVYLGSSAANYITGQVLCVDGGLYMATAGSLVVTRSITRSPVDTSAAQPCL